MISFLLGSVKAHSTRRYVQDRSRGRGPYKEMPRPVAWRRSRRGTVLGRSQLANKGGKSAAELGTLLPPAAATDCRDLLQAEGWQAAVKPTSPEPA